MDDVLVLRVIKDMYSSASMEFKIIENKNYMWVNYTYLYAQIPIIGTKRNITNKIKCYEDKGLIERRLLHERKGQKGNFAYIKPTEKLDSLQDYDPYEKFSQGLGKTFPRVTKSFPNKDSSIKDSSIKDTTTSRSQFSELATLYQKCGFKVTGLTADWLTEISNEYGFEWCRQALLVAEKSGKLSKSYVEGILQNWNRSGGMKLEKKEQKASSPYDHLNVYE